MKDAALRDIFRRHLTNLIVDNKIAKDFEDIALSAMREACEKEAKAFRRFSIEYEAQQLVLLERDRNPMDIDSIYKEYLNQSK